MLSEEIIQKLKERYNDIHPLIFHRSIEKSKKNVDLFDILDTTPKDFPICWSEDQKKWVNIQDIFQPEDFFENENKIL